MFGMQNSFRRSWLTDISTSPFVLHLDCLVLLYNYYICVCLFYSTRHHSTACFSVLLSQGGIVQYRVTDSLGTWWVVHPFKYSLPDKQDLEARDNITCSVPSCSEYFLGSRGGALDGLFHFWKRADISYAPWEVMFQSLTPVGIHNGLKAWLHPAYCQGMSKWQVQGRTQVQSCFNHNFVLATETHVT